MTETTPVLPGLRVLVGGRCPDPADPSNHAGSAENAVISGRTEDSDADGGDACGRPTVLADGPIAGPGRLLGLSFDFDEEALPGAIRPVAERVGLLTVERMSGIYFLMRGGSLVYIGKSVNVLGRLTAHPVDFDQAFFLPVSRGAITQVEMALLRLIRPPLNSVRSPFSVIDRLALEAEGLGCLVPAHLSPASVDLAALADDATRNGGPR